MRSLLYLPLFALLLTSCQSEPQNSLQIEQALLSKLAEETAILNFVAQYPYTYVAENELCEGEACQHRLQDAGLKIPVYTKEAAFMRALRQSIVIQEINLDAEVPYLRYQLRTNNKEVDSSKIFI